MPFANRLSMVTHESIDMTVLVRLQELDENIMYEKTKISYLIDMDSIKGRDIYQFQICVSKTHKVLHSCMCTSCILIAGNLQSFKAGTIYLQYISQGMTDTLNSNLELAAIFEKD